MFFSAQRLAVLALLLCQGCVTVFPEEDTHVKRLILDPQWVFKARPAKAWPLMIEKPLANEVLNSTRVVSIVRDADRVPHMDYVAEVEWSDTLPKLWQQATISAFEQSGRIMGVGSSDENFRAQHLLQGDIKKFEVRVGKEGAPSQIFLEVSYKLIQTPGGRVIKQRIFNHQQDITDLTLKSVMEGFNQASGALLQQVVEWTVPTSGPVHKGVASKKNAPKKTATKKHLKKSKKSSKGPQHQRISVKEMA